MKRKFKGRKKRRTTKNHKKEIVEESK